MTGHHSAPDGRADGRPRRPSRRRHVLLALLSITLAGTLPAQPAPSAPLPDGCFEATLPAWLVPGAAGDGSLTMRGLAHLGRRSGQMAVWLAASLPDTSIRWGGWLHVAERAGEQTWEEVALMRPNPAGGRELPIPLTAGGVRVADAKPRDHLVGTADLAVSDGGRSGRVLLHFRAFRRSTDQPSDCLAPDDPRLDVPAADEVDAGESSATLSPGVGADGALAASVPLTGPATIRRRGGPSVQGIVLCDGEKRLRVRIRHTTSRFPRAGDRVSVTLEKDGGTLFIADVPVVARTDVPDDGPYAWLEESGDGVRGAVRAAGDALLQYRSAAGRPTMASHPLVVDARFRATDWEDRVAALAAPRDYARLDPTERGVVERTATCGVP